MNNPWMYGSSPVLELPDCVGFIYKITNLKTNKSYIGKKLKFFQVTKTKTVTLKSGLKKKKKSKSHVESDWKSYYSSSAELNADVLSLGEINFKREILCFCQSKSECSYMEIKYQLQFDVLLDPLGWYNGIVNCKIHRNHLKYLWK